LPQNYQKLREISYFVFKQYRYKITGKITCHNEPVHEHTVITFYDYDCGLNANDYLAMAKTDAEGRFAVEFSHDEEDYNPPEPFMQIVVDCVRGNF
jgi:hypothetical protein